MNNGVGHSIMQEEEKWKRLWKLDVLPRVRVFWWRVLKGILPDFATLTGVMSEFIVLARIANEYQRHCFMLWWNVVMQSNFGQLPRMLCTLNGLGCILTLG
jgi:hypothetical protein